MCLLTESFTALAPPPFFPSLRPQTSSLGPPHWCVIIYLTLLDVPGRNSWCLVNRSLSSVISDTVDSGH